MKATPLSTVNGVLATLVPRFAGTPIASFRLALGCALGEETAVDVLAVLLHAGAVGSQPPGILTVSPDFTPDFTRYSTLSPTK